jgi:hypothetical protein
MFLLELAGVRVRREADVDLLTLCVEEEVVGEIRPPPSDRMACESGSKMLGSNRSRGAGQGGSGVGIG